MSPSTPPSIHPYLPISLPAYLYPSLSPSSPASPYPSIPPSVPASLHPCVTFLPSLPPSVSAFLHHHIHLHIPPALPYLHPSIHPSITPSIFLSHPHSCFPPALEDVSSPPSLSHLSPLLCVHPTPIPAVLPEGSVPVAPMCPRAVSPLLVCPCGAGSACTAAGECCHAECLGGCGRPRDRQACVACRHFHFNGHCLPSCPPRTYEYEGWRCVTAEYCASLRKVSDNPRDASKFVIHQRQCLSECPSGYTRNESRWGYPQCPGIGTVVACWPAHIPSLSPCSQHVLP